MEKKSVCLSSLLERNQTYRLFPPVFYLILFCLSIFSAVTAESNTQDVAGSKLAFQSSLARASVASAAVDGDNTTCTITEREDQPNKVGPFWTVELGAIYTISAVYINAGKCQN